MRFIDSVYILEWPGDSRLYPYKVVSKFVGDEYSKRIDWCLNNLSVQDWAIDPYVNVGFEYYFKNESDAMLFKLMFPDV